MESTGISDSAECEQPIRSESSGDISENAPVSEKKSRRKTLKELRKIASATTQTVSNMQEDKIVLKENKAREMENDLVINGEEEWGDRKSVV